MLRTTTGVMLIGGGALTLLSLFNVNEGGWIAQMAGTLMHAVGLFGAVILALVALAAGLALLSNRRLAPLPVAQVIAGEFSFFAFLALMHSLAFHAPSHVIARSGDGGGAIGWVLAELLWRIVGVDGDAGPGAGRAATTLVWLTLFLGSAWMGARRHLVGRRTAPQPLAATPSAQDSFDAHITGAPPAPSRTHTDPFPIRGRQLRFDDAPPAANGANPSPAPARTRVDVEAGVERATPRAQKKSNVPDNPPTRRKSARRTNSPRPASLPPPDLLARIKPAHRSDADVRRQAEIIETTLMQFGLAGKVVEIRQGPAVTQFGVEPGYLDKPAANGDGRRQKVRVGQIAALQNDFALALAASSIRIEAPVPGRSLVGIEVPNASVTAVDLRSLIESEAFRRVTEKSPLAFGLGRDVSGQPICADLARMPHLLIAGTTGSGKSICISAITLSLVMNNRPEDLRLVMIDPKRVELSRFNGLPHIIGRPESEPDRTPAVLKWAVSEMEQRYKKFESIGARNLDEYNASMRAREEQPLPRIVILIDELADMMLQAPVETEKQICRLAQMARATGMHMVVATQRPSVDVVTGLIKANFPARMSFNVASSTDSRVILDQAGAETLLSRGDMLFINPESGQPQRIQGCYVGENDITAVIAWWKRTMQAEQSELENADADEQPGNDEGAYIANRKPELETPWDLIAAELAAERISGARGSSHASSDDEDDGDDALIQQALEIIRKSGSVSASLLQRKLRIGYPRAARLMEDLQALGHVEPRGNTPTKPRAVLSPHTRPDHAQKHVQHEHDEDEQDDDPESA